MGHIVAEVVQITTYPQTRDYGAPEPATISQQSRRRQERSALFFRVNRRGGNVILRHRHIQPVLIRDWSPRMDGITATIWASRTTGHPSTGHQRNSPVPADLPLWSWNLESSEGPAITGGGGVPRR